MTIIWDINGKKTQNIKAHNNKISKNEVECLYKLLRKIFVYQPKS